MAGKRRDGRGQNQSGLIAGRFRLQEVVAAGGMGEVHKARDVISHIQVCVKLLRTDEDRDGERFEQEATILSALQHPAIVRYLAHGQVEDDRYIVMEWLDGEDLGRRIERSPLSLVDTVLVLRQAAEALAYAHSHDVIHRDIKPHNLFLLEGKIGQLKVLDFGIARLINSLRRFTRTGNLVGTPGYLAPEMIDGGGNVDGRADVFSLACVAHECLTGKPAFRGHEPGVLLAKLMLEDPPHLSESMPEVPRPIGDLVVRMLAKNPEKRPTAAQVLRTLTALGDLSDSTGGWVARVQDTQLTVVEQRVSCIVMASGGGTGESPIDGNKQVTPVMAQAGAPPALAELEARLSLRYSAKTYGLPDGKIVITLPEGTNATDQAMIAARCALQVHAFLPEAPVVVVLGTARFSRRSTVGAVIEQAARLLRKTPPGRVRLDENTVSLLGSRFDLLHETGATYLRGPRESIEAKHSLLGKPAPFLGRGQELSFLAGLLSDSALERQAAAVLVQGPAGIGKSRLLEEFLSWMRTRPESFVVLFGAGDSLAAGAPFALLGRAVRRYAGIVDSDTADARRQKLADCVGRHLPPESRAGVTAFIGEIAGVSYPESDHESLRGARQNPVLMADCTRRAFEDWMHAECEANPVLVVLEDLQWGDAGTVNLLDGALRSLRDDPFMVLALARPDLQQVFPNLWAERQVHTIQLPPLSRRASQRLIRDALGGQVSEETVSQLVLRGDGNPFFLEELVRATHAGRGGEVPVPILGMVQARLESEAPEDRRVLRAAAVFGDRFTRDAVATLLGGERSSVGESLERLCDKEMVNLANPPVAFDGSPSFMFAHALIREAAYVMLTDEDRILGHRLAAKWLLEHSSPEPIVLAEHLGRGGDVKSAAFWYRRAAEQALKANDLAGALARTELGLTALAKLETEAQESKGGLLLIKAEAHRWRGEFSQSECSAMDALALLAPGSPVWFRAAGQLLVALGSQGKAQDLGALISKIRAVEPQLEARDAFLACLGEGAHHLITAGLLASADALLDEAARLSGFFSDIEPQAAGLVRQARGARLVAKGQPMEALEELESAWALFEQAGDHRHACTIRTDIGALYAELGELDRAVEILRDVVAFSEKLALAEIIALGRRDLARVLGWRKDFLEAERLARMALEFFATRGSARDQGLACLVLSEILIGMARFEEASSIAEKAGPALAGNSVLRSMAMSLFARARLRAGHPEQASHIAHAAYYGALESLSSKGDCEAVVRLVYAECLLASNDIESARQVLSRAKDTLLTRAGALRGPANREVFLSRVPHHADILRLADQQVSPGAVNKSLDAAVSGPLRVVKK